MSDSIAAAFIHDYEARVKEAFRRPLPWKAESDGNPARGRSYGLETRWERWERLEDEQREACRQKLKKAIAAAKMRVPQLMRAAHKKIAAEEGKRAVARMPNEKEYRDWLGIYGPEMAEKMLLGGVKIR